MQLQEPAKYLQTGQSACKLVHQNGTKRWSALCVKKMVIGNIALYFHSVYLCRHKSRTVARMHLTNSPTRD